MLVWFAGLGRQKLFRQFVLPYAALCFVCLVVSSFWYDSSGTPGWAKLPPISPYLPHLPPPRSPSIAHLTLLQKDALLKLNYEGSISPLHYGKDRTDQALRELYRCMMDVSRECELSPKGRVVILEADYFRWYLAGSSDGEHIWAGSVLDALYALGYTVLITESAEESNRLYADLSVAVVAVIKTRDQVERCAQSEGRRGTCLESDRNTRGIPIWKIFSMYFFPTPAHPLGSAWTLSPEPYHYHQHIETEARYLGYSIEGACMSTKMVPFAERSNRAWLLAKYEEYFTSPEMAWDAPSFPRIAAAASVDLTGGFVLRSDPEKMALGHVDGVTNLGRMNRTEFVEEMSKSKVLVGIGNPAISPTPYEALCLGIPFINPIKELDPANPQDRLRWWTQHNGLIELDPPYVYHVPQHDEVALTAAIKQAIATPIERMILPRMRQAEVQERVRKMVDDVDWWRKWQATVGGSWGELYGQVPDERPEEGAAAQEDEQQQQVDDDQPAEDGVE